MPGDPWPLVWAGIVAVSTAITILIAPLYYIVALVDRIRRWHR